MKLQAVNKNGEVYNIEVPDIIERENKEHVTEMHTPVGIVQLNNGAFLVYQNEKKIGHHDFTEVSETLKNVQFEIKKPTGIEIFFMNYINSKIQEKINLGIINSNELTQAYSSINMYVNQNQELLSGMRELDNKDKMVVDNKPVIMKHFDEAMNNNKYFQKEQHLTPAPEETQQVPEYDEPTVTEFLKIQAATPNSNFDVEQFINQYFNNLTIKQIDLLLNNFNLSEQQSTILKQKKETTQVFNSLEKAEVKQEQASINEQPINVVEKRKRHTLLGEKNSNKKAAFVDTLLLSFTIGTLCGVYLMYFVLTIMS